jgi:anti-sigma regulatory factor (Ser/Thr protein kinase)
VVRDFVTERARSAGFDPARLPDLVLAVNELATNSLRHATGSGVLRTWEDGGTFFCEVVDRGRIDDPLAGRERPTDTTGGGRGLWIVNHLCDLVQVRSSSAGNVVRLHMAI